MKYTNKCNLPQRKIRQLSLEHKPVEGRMSITQLIDSPLIRTLKMERWDDLTADYSDYLLQSMGVRQHKHSELMADDDDTAEHKFVISVDDWDVVGKSDLNQNGLLIDEKYTKVGYLKFNKDKLTAQLNCYGWGERKEGREVHSLEGDINYRDWNWKIDKWQRRRFPDYPLSPFENIKVPLWTFEQQQQYIETQLHYHTVNAHKCCPEEDRWPQLPTFCVMSKINPQANSQKNCSTYVEAENWIKTKNKKNVEIVERPGCYLRCEYFCILSKSGVCPYFKKG